MLRSQPQSRQVNQVAKISGFVIAYNREKILETCLQSLRWVDELIVIDKSSTDATAEIAKKYADVYETVPWSPSVEGTRSYASQLASHDFVVFLDDDECLSPLSRDFFRKEAINPIADCYRVPCRHYILGEHNEAAYYWPQTQVRAYQRGKIEFSATVHGGIHCKGTETTVPIETGVCFHNFSHADVATWIAKTNRYTDIRDRSLTTDVIPENLGLYARERMDYWLSQRSDGSLYCDSVAILRAIYDIVDTLKRVEGLREPGDALFDSALHILRSQYAAAVREIHSL